MDNSFDFSQTEFPYSQNDEPNPENHSNAEPGMPYSSHSLRNLDSYPHQHPESSAYYPPDVAGYPQYPPDLQEEDEDEEVQEKPMSDFANQRFKRTTKTVATSVTKRTRSSDTPESPREAEYGEAGDAEEADQDEADEFFSQLIRPTAGDGNENAGIAIDENGRRVVTKKRPRWHVQESDFFRKCAALFDCNYTMIHDFLPHRTVADLKKQYDKQRVQYSSLYASFGTTPRFETVEEYHRLKAELEVAKEKLGKSMRSLGVKPWSDHKRKRKIRSDAPDSDEEEEEEPSEVEPEEEEEAEEEEGTEVEETARETVDMD